MRVALFVAALLLLACGSTAQGTAPADAAVDGDADRTASVTINVCDPCPDGG